MTHEQINRLIAEKVMGFSIIGRSTRWWLRTENWDELTNFSSIPDNPVYFDPYHRIEHAMMAAEKIKLFRKGYLHQLVTNEWCVASKERIGSYLGKSDTAPAAICLACIEAGVNYGTILHHNSDH